MYNDATIHLVQYLAMPKGHAPLTKRYAHTLEPIQNRAKEIQKISQNIPSLVTPKLNEALIRSIEIEGVEQVINQMDSGKAPGLDGFTANFFHHFWDLVKECWRYCH